MVIKYNIAILTKLYNEPELWQQTKETQPLTTFAKQNLCELRIRTLPEKGMAANQPTHNLPEQLRKEITLILRTWLWRKKGIAEEISFANVT